MGQTQGSELPYDVEERYTCLSSKTIWSVHAGKKKNSGEPVTVFVFDFTNKSPEEIKLAQAAHLRLKTLRHPNILKYIDGIELPTSIYVVTEEAIPLEDYLTTKDGSSNFSTAWGLHQIIKSISFLNNDCSLVHHNICLSSVFVDEAGEWKLAGVEFMHAHGDTSPPRKYLELLHKYDPPESARSGAARRTEKWSVDMWGLGCLVWEVFNGPLRQVSSLKNTSKIPKSLVPHYCELVSANPKSRPNPSVLLSSLREHGGFLANNYVSIALRIEELQIMEGVQRNEFFSELNNSLDSFPESFAKHKILPQLINAFEFGGAGSSVLAPLFKLGGLLKGEQYQKKIVPCVVKLFSSTDRATRLNLLQQLHHFIDHLLPATVNDQIFPHIANGFSDTAPAIRELTVKATVLLVPKLSSSTLNGPLLKYLAKCQMDEQPSIRTNTNICLGKIAGHLSASTRQKVLVTAFMRALKDPFPPARIAAIGSMGATHAFISTSDVSSRVLPALCTITVDKEKPVRDQAFQTIKFFLGKLERLSEDPQAAAEQEKIEATTNSWTGWAVSSLTSKFYKTPKSQATPTGDGAKGTAEGETQRGDVAKDESKSKSSSVGVRKPQRSDIDSSDAGDDGEDEKWEECNTEVQSSRDPGGGWESDGDVVAKDDSDMEGWDDDGWGTFDSTPQREVTAPKSQQQPQVSSGADFFDNFGANDSKRTKPKDPFEEFGFSSAQSQAKKERTPPPLTSASLFGSGPSGKPTSTEKHVSRTTEVGDTGGWGDWGEDFDVDPAPKEEKHTSGTKLGVKHQASSSTSTVVTKSSHATSTKLSDVTSGDGWGFEDSDWGTFDAQPAPATSAGMGVAGQSKQEMLQKKREERRLKQQAAREKRAAGTGIKPGLGAVKKD